MVDCVVIDDPVDIGSNSGNFNRRQSRGECGLNEILKRMIYLFYYYSSVEKSADGAARPRDSSHHSSHSAKPHGAHKAGGFKKPGSFQKKELKPKIAHDHHEQKACVHHPASCTTSHSTQELREQRKSGSSKTYELVTGVKKLWEQARIKTLTKAARKPLIDQIVELIKGKATDVWQH